MSDNSSNIATLAAAIQLGVQNILKDLHTSMPGIIESFDPEKQLATVQPAVRRIFKTLEEDKEVLTPTDLPLLINVPVIFPRGGGFSLTFPVKKGDECLLSFCERAIDTWHKFGGVNNPNAKRFHSLSDATCFVGLSSEVNKIPNYSADHVQLKADDDSVGVTLQNDGNIVINAESDITVNAATANVNASDSLTIDSPETTMTGNLTVNGNAKVDTNLEVTGDTTLGTTVTSGGVDISGTHTHAGSPTAPDGPITPTGVPV